MLNKSPQAVIWLRRGSGWPQLEQFPLEVKQVLAIPDQIASGFNPVQLVDTCRPLRSLSVADRKDIRDAVHAAYLACFDAESLADELRKAATGMDDALTVLLAEWHLPDEQCTDSALHDKWCNVLVVAERLRDALDALPRGPVLP